MRAPRSRLFFANAPPATAPPTPPITAPWVFLSPGRLSQPASGVSASEATMSVTINLLLSMSGSLRVWVVNRGRENRPANRKRMLCQHSCRYCTHGFEAAGLDEGSEEFIAGCACKRGRVAGRRGALPARGGRGNVACEGARG